MIAPPNGAVLSPVLAFDPATKLFVGVDQTIGFSFSCTPRPGGDDRVEQQLRAALEDEWPVDTQLQWLLYASANCVRALNRAQAARSASGLPEDEAWAIASVDWLRSRLDAPFDEMPGLWLRRFRLVVSAKYPIEGAVPSKVEMDRALQLSRRLETSLAALDLLPEQLDNAGWLGVCSELVNRGPDASWRRFGEVPVDRSRFLRDQVLDLGSAIRIERDRIDLEGGGVLMCCSPKAWSESTAFGAAKFLVCDVLSGRRGLRGPFFYALNIHYPDAQARKTALAAKRAYTVNAAYGPLVKWLPAISQRHQDFETLFASIEDGHRVVQMQLTIGLYGRDAAEAQRAATDAANYWAEHNHVLLPDRFILAPLLITSLPLGADHRIVGHLGRASTMTTEHAALYAPIFGSWTGTGTPVLTPVGRDGQLMSFDLFDSKANFNAVVAGESGSGKSVFMQLMSASYLCAGAVIWTIDIGGSYRNLCERMGGEHLDFEEAGLSINPFRLVGDFREESDILESLLGAMAASREPLTDFQRAALARSLKTVWDAKGREAAIDDVAAALRAAPDQRARDVGEQLYPFTSDGPHGRYFSGDSTITFRNRYTVLELQGLQSRKHLQRIVLLQLIFQIQHAMARLPRDRRKILMIDEAWQLLADGEVGRFIEPGYRRFRKQRGAVVIATQSLGDLYNTEVGVAIAENSSHKVLLQQRREVIDRLVEAKRLSIGPATAALLQSIRTERDRYAEAFVMTDAGADVARIVLDPATRLLFSTNAWDVAALDRLRAQGLGLEAAVERLLTDRAAPPALAAE